jgi:hypothetical protein
MNSIGVPQKVSLAGEVIETFEKEGKFIAKILLKSFQLEVPLDVLDAPHLDSAHLGDAVLLETSILVEKIESGLGQDGTEFLDSESEYFP